MKRSLLMATTRVAVAASAIALTMLGAGAASATVVPHDPNCPVGETGSPGNISYTATIYDNPCSRSARAWVACILTDGVIVDLYGPTVTYGNSKASCGIADVLDGYGHQVYYNGSWATYNG